MDQLSPPSGPDKSAARLFGGDRPVAEIVEASGSSFLAALKISKGDKRAAMYALYAFARILDDIADEPAEPAERRRALSFWRGEVANLDTGPLLTPTSEALSAAYKHFNLPRAELDALIDGVAMDVEGPICAPSSEDLALYCRRVAGAVGICAIHIYGDTSAESHRFALHLADALQLTNILRDLAEDARNGRLYLPQDLLLKAEIEATVPDIVLADERLKPVLRTLAGTAKERFTLAEAAYRTADQRALRPAKLMLDGYKKVLQRIETLRFPTTKRVSLPLTVKAKLAVKALLASW